MSVSEDAKVRKTDPKRNAAYTAAVARLRDSHSEEFRRYYDEEMGLRGVVVRQRRTKAEVEEKRKADAAARLEKKRVKQLEKIAKLRAEADALESEVPF